MQKGYSVKFNESTNPFKDILIPAKRREGYVDGSQSVLPVYFYRQIGIAGLDSLTQDQFYNDIYRLNQELSKHPSGYVKMESPILMPNNDEIKWAVTGVAKGIPSNNQTLKDSIVTQVINSGVLQMFVSSMQNQLIIPAFESVMNLYMRIERNMNESKAENFALKMISWLKRFSTLLFKESKPTDVPKVLFYGDIKNHEVYLLTLLALIGCDVLYITTEKGKDNLFDDLNALKELSKKVELIDSLPLESFPITERTIQKTTIAYNASQELQATIYNGEVGLFKARQYENGNTKPVMLKTTYDELKILWNEEARIRPEFEVRDETVYVPNLFAKVNGTHEDIQVYWKDVHELAKADHVVLFKKLPFSTVSYTRQELYSAAFLFTKDGLVNKEALFNSPLYKLKYLKPSLQDFMVGKINELLVSRMLKSTMDENMRLKVLMTVITMSPELLRLLETFDYTGKVPKLVIYDGTPDLFSEEDAILLAFFHLVGADIVIFTPTNYANIENCINHEFFATHQLPSVQFDMVFEENKLLKAKNELSTLAQQKDYMVLSVVVACAFIGAILAFIF